MSDQINFDVLEGVAEGDKLVVCFKPQAGSDLTHVIAMTYTGVLTVSMGDLMFLDAVRRTNDWEGDDNRTQTLVVGPRWNRPFFEGRMGRVPESLQVERAR